MSKYFFWGFKNFQKYVQINNCITYVFALKVCLALHLHLQGGPKKSVISKNNYSIGSSYLQMHFPESFFCDFTIYLCQTCSIYPQYTITTQQLEYLLQLQFFEITLFFDSPCTITIITLSVSAPFISPTQVVRLVWARMWPGPWYH